MITLLETLHRLNAERTQGRWDSKAWSEDREYYEQEVADEDFIAALANSCTKLLDVVEKAKIVSATLQVGGADGYVDTHTAADLAEAIAALESPE